MAVRQTRILIGSILLAGFLLPAFAAPVAAACGLSAPASVAIGSLLEIHGSGFPADAIVEVSISIEGGASDEFTVPSDGNGAFVISFTPEAADTGLTTVTASTGAACTADAVIGVGVPAPTAPQGSESGGTGAAAPPTDGLGNPGLGDTTSSRPWVLAGVLFVIGLGGLYLTRPARSR
jgi:hypothetical protein